MNHADPEIAILRFEIESARHTALTEVGAACSSRMVVPFVSVHYDTLLRTFGVFPGIDDFVSRAVYWRRLSKAKQGVDKSVALDLIQTKPEIVLLSQELRQPELVNESETLPIRI
jgi:hypothetical protein